jgi:hypothetical protein
MKDEMEDLLEIVKKMNEERRREYDAAMKAGYYTRAEELAYAVDAFGMVEWLIIDPKLRERIRRLEEQDTLDERKDEIK